MIPIAKNILVVDEQGNEYEATWPKRARGLVKNGRARFLSENKICLACPPWIDMEDNEMTDVIMTDIQVAEDAIEAFRTAVAAGFGAGSETETDKINDESRRMPEARDTEGQGNGLTEGSETENLRGSISDTVRAEIPQGTATENGKAAYHTGMAGAHRTEESRAASAADTGGIDMVYIFDQIRAIQNQTDYLLAAIDGLAGMSDGESGDMYAPGNIMGQAKATAFGDMVRCRETTNQQLLNFYMTVYNDLKSQA